MKPKLKVMVAVHVAVALVSVAAVPVVTAVIVCSIKPCKVILE